MSKRAPLPRQFPGGLVAVFMLLIVCTAYTVYFPPVDSPHANAQPKAESLLLNGVQADDPEKIHEAVALCGRLPDELADVALNLAACEKHQHAAAELLKEGVTPNSRTLHGRTALMTAAGIRGNAAMVQQLLDAGADPTAIACDGDTALIEARANMDQQEIRILTDALAGHNQPESFVRSPK